jgi:hypothetical protein
MAYIIAKRLFHYHAVDGASRFFKFGNPPNSLSGHAFRKEIAASYF